MDAVTYRVDIRYDSLENGIHRYPAALIFLDAQFFESQILRVGPPAHADQQHFAL